MKSSKTSDPNPISLYRALTLPLQTHAPPRRIHVTGARRSESAWTSLKSDSLWDEARPKVDKLASVPEFWAVAVEPEAPPYTKPVPLEAVVVTAVVDAGAVDVCSVVTPVAVEATVEATTVDVVVPPMVVVAVVVLAAVLVSVTVALDTVFETVAELTVDAEVAVEIELEMAVEVEAVTACDD